VEVIEAPLFLAWLKEVKVVLNSSIDDIVHVLLLDDDYPNLISVENLLSAIDKVEENTFMETHLFCKLTDDKELKTERNFFR